MKKIKLFFVIILSIFIFVEIVINVVLNLTQRKFLSKYIPNLKIIGAVYILPNIGLLLQPKYVDENVEIKTTAIFSVIKLNRLFKKQFFVEKLYSKNVKVNFKKNKTAKVPTDKQTVLSQFLVYFPQRIKVKNIQLNYNNETVLIDNLSGEYLPIGKVCLFLTGKWRGYRFNVDIINDIHKAKFLTKGKLFFPAASLITGYYIDFEASGNYDLYELKNLKISVVSGKEKYTMYSTVKIQPLEIDGNIKTEVLHGKFNFTKKDDIVSIVYDGSFNLRQKLKKKLGFEVPGDFKTKVMYVKGPSLSNIIAEIKNKKLAINLAMDNNRGNFRIKLGDRYIYGNIFYDDEQKCLLLRDTRGGKDINFLLTVCDKNKFSSEGNFLNYKFSCQGKFEKNNRFINLSLYKPNVEQLAFQYISTFSVVTAKIYYENVPKNINLDTKLMYDVNNEINLTVLCKNVNILKHKLSFNMSAKVSPNKDLLHKRLYDLTILLRNININKSQILKEILLTGTYYDDVIQISGTNTDKSISLDGNWNLKDNIANLSIAVSKKILQLDKFTARDAIVKILINKHKVINISCDYSLSNLSYNKFSIAKFIVGEVTYDFDKKCLISTGQVGFTSKIKGNYKTDLYFDKNKLYVKFYELTLPEVLGMSQAEFWFDLKEGLVGVYGRIYNTSSEIIISSGIVNLDGNIASLTAKIKNLVIKNTNIICDLFLETIFVDMEKLEVKTLFKNLWINNYLLDKLNTKCIVFLEKNLISFMPFERKEGNAYLLGDINISKGRVEVRKFRFVLSGNRELVCDGKVGQRNDLLAIKLKDFPIEVISTILYPLIPITSGKINADCVLISVDPEKKIYHVNGSFNVQNLELATLKLQQISGKVSSSKDDIYFEKINFIFKPNNVIVLNGIYNTKTKNLDFMLYSQKCDLSIFEGFMDIVKTAKGSFVVDLKIKGKLQEPKLYGYIYTPKGEIVFNRYAKYLNNISFKLNFSGTQIKIDKCAAEYEQTKLVVDGDYDVSKNRYTISIKTKGGNGIFMEIPELSYYPSDVLKIIKSQKRFISNGNLHFDLVVKKDKKSDLPTVIGNIVMNNTNFTYPGTEGKKIANVADFYYDITLSASNNVWYENESLSANIVGKLRFKYAEGMRKSDVNGEVQALRGKVKFLNTQLELRSGEVEIIKRDVYITLEAETEIFTEYEKIPVKLTIARAKIENIQPKLCSPVYPQLTTEELTSLMLGAGKLQKYGDKVEVYAAKKIDYLPYLKAQVLKIIDVTLAEPISRNILQKWGIADKIIIEQIMPTSADTERQELSATETTGVSAVDIVKDIKYGIEKYLTPNMAISYSVTLAEIKNRLNLKHEFEISYRIKNNIFIKGIYDYAIRDYNTGRYSGDVKIQIEPRFKLKSWSEEEKEQQK